LDIFGDASRNEAPFQASVLCVGNVRRGVRGGCKGV
jgi:hypothetical protein